MAEKRRPEATEPAAGAIPNRPGNSASVSRDALLPPPKERLGGGFMIALLVHLALVVAIAVGVSWKVAAPDAVEAELWSATAVQAAPRAATPPPAPTPVPPTPAPETPPPPPPAPTPRVEAPKATPPPPPAVDPQIAIEKEKQRQADLKKQEDEEREADRKALVERRKQDQAKQQAIDAAKAQARAEAQAKAQAEAQEAAEKREAAEKQAKAEAARKQAEAKVAAALEAQRKANLERMLAQAGGSGDARSTGTAAQSSGPSAGYAGRLRARVRPNIIFPDDTQGNPVAEVEVRAGPDGTILSRRISRPSGNQAWDDAVIRAIDRTATLPQDVDGRVPPFLVITFRARDF